MAVFGTRSERFRRRFVGVVLSYVVAFQSLFMSFAGAPLAANALTDDGLPAFELCLSGSQNVPHAPTGAPGHYGDHCIFCSAGAHHALGAPPVSAFHRIDDHGGRVCQSSARRRLHSVTEYSIARPRGPPVSA